MVYIPNIPNTLSFTFTATDEAKIIRNNTFAGCKVLKRELFGTNDEYLTITFEDKFSFFINETSLLSTLAEEMFLLTDRVIQVNTSNELKALLNSLLEEVSYNLNKVVDCEDFDDFIVLLLKTIKEIKNEDCTPYLHIFNESQKIEY